MGIKVMEVVPNASFPLYIDSMMCGSHDFKLTPIIYNNCMLFDWTRNRRKEVICDIHLEDGCFCTLNHNHKKPGITFRKEKLGKNLGEVIGFAPLKDDLTGVREDIEYDFLQVEPGVVIPGHEEAGTMQRLTLKTACD